MEVEGRVCEEPAKPASHVPMEICEGSDLELRQVTEKNDASGMQSGVDASHGKLGEHSETCQVKRKRVDEMVQSGVDASHEQLGGGLKTHQAKRSRGNHDLRKLLRLHGRTIISMDLRYAKIALHFYEKRQDAKFEIVEVLFSNRATLVVPGIKGVGPWCHVSFIAKPKNSDCCGKHFFGEMVLDHASEKYNVTFCSIFEPSDPGNIEGCVFCPGSEMFLHPPYGCPAGGREIDKSMIQKGTDASQGQVRGCSKRHQVMNPRVNPDAAAMFTKDKFKYAKIALEFYEKFYEKMLDVKFEITRARQSIKRVVVPGSKSIEECCHVIFFAKPKNGDSTEIYFFGELLRDPTTGKYNPTYCKLFRRRINWKEDHDCIICPKDWTHPIEGYRVGQPPYSIVEEESYLDDLQLDSCLRI